MPALRVKVLTSADLIQNGGGYRVEGRPYALPVYTAPSGLEVAGGEAIAIYPVNDWPASEQTNWWEAGGASGCVAAYQPIGAANVAASYVNLANSGTYNITGVESWSTTDGWIFGGGNYLDSHVVPTLDGTWSMAIRLVAGDLAGFPTPIGQRENTSSFPDFAITLTNSSTTFRNGHVTGYTHGSALANGVLILAGNKAYYNGSEIGTLTVGTATGTRSIYIGAQNEMGTPLYFFSGTIQAAAIYNNTLSGAQAAALSTAMAALG